MAEVVDLEAKRLERLAIRVALAVARSGITIDEALSQRMQEIVDALRAREGERK